MEEVVNETANSKAVTVVSTSVRTVNKLPGAVNDYPQSKIALSQNPKSAV